MKDLASVLRLIRDLGLRIRVEGDKLRVRRRPSDLSINGLGEIEGKKNNLIAFLRKKTATSNPNIAPLTYRQEWHWQMMREEGSIVSNKYTGQCAIKLQGALDVGRLARSFDMLVANHEPLRTRFIEFDSIPMQQVDEPQLGLLDIEAVVALPGVEPEDTAHAILADFYSASVDLSSAPPFNAKLLTLNDSTHILAIRIHHMINDVESLTQLFRELWDSYQEICEDNPLRSQSRKFQFADYAAWQRRADFNWHESFWQEKLQGAQPVRWPMDKECDPDHRFSCRIVSLDFTERFSYDLQQLAQHLATIPGLVLLAAYAVFIRYWCNQTDFVLPFVVSGRSAPELVDAIGWFSYPLLIRLRIHDGLSFAEFTKYVVQEFMLSLENADEGRLLLCGLPFIPEGTLFRWATVTGMQNASTASSWTKIERDLDVKLFPVQIPSAQRIESRISAVFLLIEMWIEGIKGRIIYRADLLSERRMLILSQEMQCTFEKLINAPSTLICECESLINCSSRDSIKRSGVGSVGGS